MSNSFNWNWNWLWMVSESRKIMARTYVRGQSLKYWLNNFDAACKKIDRKIAWWTKKRSKNGRRGQIKSYLCRSPIPGNNVFRFGTINFFNTLCVSFSERSWVQDWYFAIKPFEFRENRSSFSSQSTMSYFWLFILRP